MGYKQFWNADNDAHYPTTIKLILILSKNNNSRNIACNRLLREQAPCSGCVGTKAQINTIKWRVGDERGGSAALTTRHPSIHKSWYYISSTSGGRSVGVCFLFVCGGMRVCTGPRFLHPCISWRIVITFKPWPLYLSEKPPVPTGWVDVWAPESV
jgi:hypothetical protein